MKHTKKNKILIITNDAGATEYIAHLILNEFKNNIKWKVVVFKNSPAENIFKKLNIEFYLINNFEELDNFFCNFKPDIIIYGTGWMVDFSIKLNEYSKKHNVKIVAVIDHWVNYRERFKNDTFPKNIIVMDDIAFKLAKKIFPTNINILQLKNFYFDYIQQKYNSIYPPKNKKIVFISEPTSIIAKKSFNDKNGFGFTEYDVVEDLIRKFDEIIIRLHPADQPDKYNDIIDKYRTKNIEIINCYDEKVFETLAKSKLTIGIDGIVLFFSYFLGIKTVAYIPGSKRKLSIPLPKKYLIDNIDKLEDINFEKNELFNLDKNAITFNMALKKIYGC